MTKFDYRKWVTENKYIISEQTGSMTGSMSTGSMTGSNSCAEFETYSEELQLQMCDAYEYVLSVGNPPSTYQGLLNIIGQNAECCPTGSMTGSLEIGMWICKDPINYPGCQQIENENQATMATGYGFTPSFSPVTGEEFGAYETQEDCIIYSPCTGIEATGSMAQGMPSPQGGSKPKPKHWLIRVEDGENFKNSN